MEYQALSESAQMKANAKKRSIYINKVDSGMPRWLIELGFVLFVAQAVCTENSINNWIESHGMEIPRTIVFLIGDFILYYGMMVGMKPLRRPFTTLWWILIVLDMAGNTRLAAVGGYPDGGLHGDDDHPSHHALSLPACSARRHHRHRRPDSLRLVYASGACLTRTTSVWVCWRYCAGVTPICFLNSVWKVVRETKPASLLTASIDQLGFSLINSLA